MVVDATHRHRAASTVTIVVLCVDAAPGTAYLAGTAPKVVLAEPIDTV
jgi:hypothetical protein